MIVKWFISSFFSPSFLVSEGHWFSSVGYQRWFQSCGPGRRGCDVLRRKCGASHGGEGRAFLEDGDGDGAAEEARGNT